MPYLYGSSVQGIQNFIFETNALREIIGGSELVEQLCTKRFDRLLAKLGATGECEVILRAAGNLRLVINSHDVVQAIIKRWPKAAMEHAPGITMSQAVVSYEGQLSETTMNELEERLKAQRNRPSRPIFPALMAMERCRKTGKPAVDRKNPKSDSGLRDLGMEEKQAAGANNAPQSLMDKLVPEQERNDGSLVKRIPFDMADITAGRESSWLGVIHADGNNLGQLIHSMGSKLNDAGEQRRKTAYTDFSKALDKATRLAAQDAFGHVILDPNTGMGGEDKDWKYPIRPVILGGDDLTVICRADIAIDFTQQFLAAFQRRTKETLASLVHDFKLDDFAAGLTACAGVCFIKESYPFHYAVTLAEDLCARAKTDAKGINLRNVPASIAFHKVQDSFVQDYGQICERELKTGEVNLSCGPYYLKEQPGGRTVGELIQGAETLLKENSPRSGIRQWLTLLYDSMPAAEQFMDRVRQIHGSDYRDLLDRAIDQEGNCPAYDWMVLASLKGGA